MTRDERSLQIQNHGEPDSLWTVRSVQGRAGGNRYSWCPGGMMVACEGVTDDELKVFAAADPAVESGLLLFEIRPWYIAMERGV